jgi:hypothetical protein
MWGIRWGIGNREHSWWQIWYNVLRMPVTLIDIYGTQTRVSIGEDMPPGNGGPVGEKRTEGMAS